MRGTVIIAVILLAAFFVSYVACFAIVRIKNLGVKACFFSLLFVLGVIIVLFLPDGLVQCKNCGCRYNPKKGLICPICGESISHNGNRYDDWK